MSNELEKKLATASIAAVEQYIALRKENSDRHWANVLVSANGKDLCPGKRLVFAEVSENAAKIIVEDFCTLCGERSNIFTTDDSSFYFICKTLQIKSKDTFKRPITVEITGA